MATATKKVETKAPSYEDIQKQIQELEEQKAKLAENLKAIAIAKYTDAMDKLTEALTEVNRLAKESGQREYRLQFDIPQAPKHTTEGRTRMTKVEAQELEQQVLGLLKKSPSGMRIDEVASAVHYDVTQARAVLNKLVKANKLYTEKDEQYQGRGLKPNLYKLTV